MNYLEEILCFQSYVREHDIYKDKQEAIMRNAYDGRNTNHRNKNENQPTYNSAINIVKEINTAKNLIAYTVWFIGASSVLDGGVVHSRNKVLINLGEGSEV